MKGVTEDAVEQAMLEWLTGLGWSVAHGPDISPPDAKTPGTERGSYRYREVALLPRLISGKLRLPEAQEHLEENPA
jgi:type I restriction enzyme R subunit